MAGRVFQKTGVHKKAKRRQDAGLPCGNAGAVARDSGLFAKRPGEKPSAPLRRKQMPHAAKNPGKNMSCDPQKPRVHR